MTTSLSVLVRLTSAYLDLHVQFLICCRFQVLIAAVACMVICGVKLRRYTLIVISVSLVMLIINGMKLQPLMAAMFHPQQEDFNPSDHRVLIAEFALNAPTI
jgi:hypothetical protein